MPLLARLHIKTGLVYFVFALLLGTLLALRPILKLPAGLSAFQPVYLHLLMVGWVTQLIIGVVYWMFPKYSKENPRGSERLGWWVYGLLNVGLVLRLFGEPLNVLAGELNVGWLLALSAVLQMLAGWGFIANTWPRVKVR